MAENTIKKLEEQLNCAICLDTYTDPKLLQCFHIYCRKCLVKLVVRDQQGQLALTCPTCCQATPIPANGVAGLKSAFHINHLLEILEELKKAKDTAASQEGAKSVVTHPICPKKVIANCFEHIKKERELYCETCGDLICYDCVTKWGKHQNHDYHTLDEAFEIYKGEITPSLEPLERKLEAVKEGLALLDKRNTDISNQQTAINTSIQDTIEQTCEILHARKTKLMTLVNEITQGKFKGLAVQRDLMETIQAQLNSCLDFVRESLKTSVPEEMLMMRTNIVKQVKELTSIQPNLLQPDIEADIEVSFPLYEMMAMCQNYGQVCTEGVPDPLKCHALGKGLETAVVGEESTFIVITTDFKGHPCTKSINLLQCELVSRLTGTTERGKIRSKRKNEYEICYQPTIKGRHQLHVKVLGKHIRGSPFDITAIKKLGTTVFGTPILTIKEVKKPTGVAVNRRGEVVVMESDNDHVSIFSPSGAKIRSFGTRDSGGYNETPLMAVDNESCILLAVNDHIKKFTADGLYKGKVGGFGEGDLQFNTPMGIAFNAYNDKVYVTDSLNHRIQVLNSDLTFSSVFGEGQFRDLGGIACDSTGKVYVTDHDNDRIQVFTAEGKFVGVFWKYESDRGELHCPAGISIDNNGIVYVTDFYSDSVSVFTSKGQFMTSFGERGDGPGKFKYPCGVAVDNCGVVYVCDSYNNRIQVF